MTRCYMACLHDRVLKAALICGPDMQAIGTFSNLVQGSCLISVAGSYVNRCDFNYKRTVLRIGKWSAILILSKDPRCLWQDDDGGLLEGMKKSTETPFLPEWVPVIRERLIEERLLRKFEGWEPQGSFLDCTSEQMDKIVSAGVVAGTMRLCSKSVKEAA